jgi:hypothetical protein
MSAASSAPSAFADITPLLAHLPAAPEPLSSETLVAHLDRYSVKPGPLLPLLLHLQRWQNKTPVLAHPRVCAFASHYASDTQHTTQQTINALQGEGHPLKKLAAILNADLRVYELDLAQTDRNPAQAAQAMTYGMLAIEDKGDVVVIASLSDGVEAAAQKTTIGTGSPDDILNALVSKLGLDFFAALGACLAARLAKQPVFVSGAFGVCLIDVLNHLAPQAADHLYLCETSELTQTLPPVFTPVHALQQTAFLLSFLPAPLKTIHVSGLNPTPHAKAV